MAKAKPASIDANLISSEVAASILGIGEDWFLLLVKDDDLPSPIPIYPTKKMWDRGEVMSCRKLLRWIGERRQRREMRIAEGGNTASETGGK